MASVRAVRKKKTDYPKAFAEVQRRFLPEAGIMVEGQAKALVPVDEGNLKGSINSQVKGEQAIVGTNVDYAPHVEYGTRFMRAQPFMRPAIDEKRKDLLRLFQEVFREVFRGR